MRHSAPITSVLILIAALFTACSSSPVAPTSTSSPAASTTTTSPSGAGMSGRALDAVTGAPLPSITVSLDTGASATTAADGCFLLTAPVAGLHSVIVTGPGVVQRETAIRTPSADAALSLIPSQFDIATYDKMIRDGGSLHRWTTAPSLVIIDAVLQFTNASDSTFTALDERLTPEESASIAADLAWGLPQATGNTFSAFASVTIESPAAGAPVNFFSRDGKIVVARFRGLSQATGYWGYGRSARRDNDVVAGAVLIDRDFEVARGPYVRSLRVHELGHALGYCHVTTRVSFMNPAAISEPNDFDRDATRIAFQRPPGNQAPDRDPAKSLMTMSSGAMSWGTITP
jgi:hypothetical protein